MQKITTAAQMRNMDRIAMHGVYAMAPAVLMENAGHAVAERAGAWLDGWDGKDVVLFCGKGNNGGDGFVIARHILAAGARVYVYVLGKEEDYSDEARQHLHKLLQKFNILLSYLISFHSFRKVIKVIAKNIIYKRKIKDFLDRIKERVNFLFI